VLIKVSLSDFEIVSAYFIFMRLILVVCGFCRDIRVASVYFVVDDLFCCLCWSFVGMSADC
jgi:hypothetical protein